MKRLLKQIVALGLVASFALVLGCQRTPEDLEEWRDARGGMEQLAEWAGSDRESMPVRIRALQIMIEEGAGEQVTRVLDRVEDPEVRQDLADGAMGGVETLWAADDIPEFTEELRAGGGAIAIGQSAQAKDIAYHLYPYLGPEQKERAHEIFREWMREEQEFRTQIGQARIPMLLLRAGDGAIELLKPWIMTAHDPREVVAQLRQNVTEESEHRVIDAAVAERATEEHPDVSRELQHAVVGAETDAIVPYLEKAIMDPAITGDFLQGSLDTLVEVHGEDAGDFLARVVEERDGVLRWAAANALIDARDDRGMVDIARALPTDASAYDAGADDSLKRYTTQICNYYGIAVERRELEDHQDSLRAVLEQDTWMAQTLFLLCAARTGASELMEEVAGLKGNRTQLPRWGERMTVGQLATQVEAALSGEGED